MSITKLGKNIFKSTIYLAYWGICTVWSCTLAVVLELTEKFDEGIEDLEDIWHGIY